MYKGQRHKFSALKNIYSNQGIQQCIQKSRNHSLHDFRSYIDAPLNFPARIWIDTIFVHLILFLLHLTHPTPGIEPGSPIGVYSPTLIIYQAHSAGSYLVLQMISKYTESLTLKVWLPCQQIYCETDPQSFIPRKIGLILEPGSYHSINLPLPSMLSLRAIEATRIDTFL